MLPTLHYPFCVLENCGALECYTGWDEELDFGDGNLTAPTCTLWQLDVREFSPDLDGKLSFPSAELLNYTD